jgi:Cft2 family RNA processing exonuclease
MDTDTPGYRVMASAKGELIQLSEIGEYHKVNCEIERFYFSSHSRREGLLEIVKQVNPKSVVLVHGDHKSKDWLGYQILEKYGHIKLHSAEPGKQIIIN